MRRVIVIILGVIIGILLIFNYLYMSISRSISYDSVRKNIESEILSSGFIYDDDGNKSDIFMTILKITTLEEEYVIRLMEHELVDKHLVDIVNSIYDYNLTGDESYKYDGEYIINLVEDNIDRVTSDIDYYLSSTNRDKVIEYLYDNIDYVMDTIYSTDIGGYVRD